MTNEDPQQARLEQRAQPITTIMVLVLLVFLLQLWMITLALEDFLAAHYTLGVPTFLASGACFAINLWLLKYVYDVDRNREA